MTNTKLCRDCKHMMLSPDSISPAEKLKYARCKLFPNGGYHLIDPAVAEYEYCNVARGDYGGQTRCGSGGTKFEPLESQS